MMMQTNNLQLSIFDLDAGIRGRDAGILQVISNNECFVATARGIARILARRHGIVSCDDVRKILSEYGVSPKHGNAFGAIFRTKEWKCVGRSPSKIPENHGRYISTWRLLD